MARMPISTMMSSASKSKRKTNILRRKESGIFEPLIGCIPPSDNFDPPSASNVSDNNDKDQTGVFLSVHEDPPDDESDSDESVESTWSVQSSSMASTISSNSSTLLRGRSFRSKSRRYDPSKSLEVSASDDWESLVKADPHAYETPGDTSSKSTQHRIDRVPESACTTASANSCFPTLRLPRLPKQTTFSSNSTSVSTAPPSPWNSESDDASTAPPNSLLSPVAGIRYSVRSVINDGSERQSSNPEKMERRLLRPNGSHLNVSYWTGRNRRNYMEDRFVIDSLGALPVLPKVAMPTFRSGKERITKEDLTAIQNDFGLVTKSFTTALYPEMHRCSNSSFSVPFLQSSDIPALASASSFKYDSFNVSAWTATPTKSVAVRTTPLSWYGIFDGHGGDRASQYCCDWLSSYLRYQQVFPSDLGNALKLSFRAIDEDFCAKGLPDGTTVCTCVVVGSERVVCANAGDSRAILVKRDGSVVRLSQDHKPGFPDETRRITELGGKVIYQNKWRVEGRLAVSRGVGDADLKPFVSAEPDICEYDIGKDDAYLIVASDGIWDVLENEQVANIVLALSGSRKNVKSKSDPVNLQWLSRKLCEQARNCGAYDNLSAVVVDLKSADSETP